jgi:hypothetical protein
MESSETLVQLERIMSEFFGPTTSNDRKKEIELLLSNFSNQDCAWRECLGFLAATNNHYVSMYSLTTLEKVISIKTAFLKRFLIFYVLIVVSYTLLLEKVRLNVYYILWAFAIVTIFKQLLL